MISAERCEKILWNSKHFSGLATISVKPDPLPEGFLAHRHSPNRSSFLRRAVPSRLSPSGLKPVLTFVTTLTAGFGQRASVVLRAVLVVSHSILRAALVKWVLLLPQFRNGKLRPEDFSNLPLVPELASSVCGAELKPRPSSSRSLAFEHSLVLSP